MPFLPEFGYRTCPWCGTQDIALRPITLNVNNDVASGGSRQWSWLACPRCGAMVSLETQVNMNTLLRVVPEGASSETHVNHLPDDVAEYFANAQTVLNAGVPSAAAVELRRTLEAAARHQGINERTLVRDIEKLAEAGLITNNFVAVLGHIRKVGNLGAHASDQQLTREEVAKAMAFTTQVLRNLFEIPKELELLGTPSPDQSSVNEQASPVTASS